MDLFYYRLDDSDFANDQACGGRWIDRLYTDDITISAIWAVDNRWNELL